MIFCLIVFIPIFFASAVVCTINLLDFIKYGDMTSAKVVAWTGPLSVLGVIFIAILASKIIYSAQIPMY
jgi:hypothetical protein